MTTKDKFIAICGLLGLTILVAVLIAVWKWLPLVAIVAGVPCAAYLLFWSYNHIHRKRYEIKGRRQDHKEREQALRHADERHQQEIEGMKANRHVLLSRVALDPNGNPPILIRPELWTLPGREDVLMLPPGQLRGVRAVAEDKQIGPPDAYLPQPYKLSEVLQRFTPSKDGIFLAKGNDLITVPIGEPLCHTTFTGNTDAGKTNDERTLLIQLLFLGQIVYLCDRNYQRFRVDKKQAGVVYDYSPIEDRLAYAPATTTPEAVRVLEHLVDTLEDRRIARRKALVNFPDIYLFMDEMAAFSAEDKAVMAYVGRLVREARQYGIFFIGAVQDLLNDTMQAKGGAYRENFLTNYYGGGDATTARMVLNLARGETIDETGLGLQGVKYLRAKGAGIEHERVRTAYADNQATLTLLGSSNYVQSTIVTQEEEPMEELQPLDAGRTFWTPRPASAEGRYRDVQDVQTGSLRGDFEREMDTPPNVRTFPKRGVEQRSAQPDATSEERPKEYRLSEQEIQQFIVAYRVSGSIDKSLSAINRGARYRAHASEIVSVYGLRENA